MELTTELRTVFLSINKYFCISHTCISVCIHTYSHAYNIYVTANAYNLGVVIQCPGNVYITHQIWAVLKILYKLVTLARHCNTMSGQYTIICIQCPRIVGQCKSLM